MDIDARLRGAGGTQDGGLHERSGSQDGSRAGFGGRDSDPKYAAQAFAAVAANALSSTPLRQNSMYSPDTNTPSTAATGPTHERPYDVDGDEDSGTSTTGGDDSHLDPSTGGNGYATAGIPGQGGLPGQDSKKPRACEACRGLKVRCEPDPANPDGPCRRCAKAGRSCVVTQPTRKRQKKTDSRVAELEKKIDALTASLHATRGGVVGDRPPVSRTSTIESPILRPDPMGGAGIGLLGGMYRPPPDVRNVIGYNVPNPPIQGPTGTIPVSDWSTTTSVPGETPAPTSATSRPQPSFSAGHDDKGNHMPSVVMAGQKRKHAETRDSVSEDNQQDRWPKDRLHPLAPSTLAAEHSDIIDRGILTMERATQLFARYNDHMVPHLPAVVFPPGVTAAEIRKNKPILFLSIMSASSSEDPVTQRTLVKELMQIFADKVIVTGEKTLELVQALQVAVIWYWPPEHFEELKFYQLVHIGVIMGIDIGLGRKKQSSRLRRHLPANWRDHPFKKHPPPDPMSIEARRAWLVCYFMSSNTAMALHRPILLRWTTFMAESVDVLESSPEAAPTDKYLCHLVWTHRLAEEIGMSFSMDDPGANINISDTRTQHALKGFEHQLDKYRSTISPELMQPTLAMSINVLNLYMHEIALHTEKSEGMGLRDVSVHIDAVLTPAHISALSACLTAIDGMFEAFLSMEVSAIRCLPVFNFVRVAYAVVVLIKMYFAACSPKSEFGKVINKDNMKVDQHLENLLEKFRSAAADDKSRPAAKFLVILVMLRSWFQRQSKSGGHFRPHCRDGAKQGEDGAAEGTNANASSSNNDNIDPALQSRSLQAIPVAASMQLPTPKDYSGTANTPLQLLSEVATNDGGSSSTNGAPTANMNVANAGGLSAWATPRADSQAQPFTYDGNVVDPNAAMDWPMTAFNTDDFSLDGMLGDGGFSDAVNLTLGGMGDVLNGGADGMGRQGANSEIRNLMQEQWFGELMGQGGSTMFL